jgi:hypothetical protein
MFPGQIRSIYLIGSRVNGSHHATSDVDFAVIFTGSLNTDRRAEIVQFLSPLQTVGPVMIDISILDECEIKNGITPNLQRNQLLRGVETLRKCPLQSNPELLLCYAGWGIHFIRAVRGRPTELVYPLEYPDRSMRYFGYERTGIRVATNRYIPGFNLLVCLITTIANFRLAAKVGVYTISKDETISNYKSFLPDDPWLPIFEGLYKTCRVELAGCLPTNESASTKVSMWCSQVLELENDFLSTVILKVCNPDLTSRPRLKQEIITFARSVKTDSPDHAAQLRRVAQ